MTVLYRCNFPGLHFLVYVFPKSGTQAPLFCGIKQLTRKCSTRTEGRNWTFVPKHANWSTMLVILHHCACTRLAILFHSVGATAPSSSSPIAIFSHISSTLEENAGCAKCWAAHATGARTKTKSLGSSLRALLPGVAQFAKGKGPSETRSRPKGTAPSARRSLAYLEYGSQWYLLGMGTTQVMAS